MKQQNGAENVTEIIFPRALNYQEVKELFRYLAFKLEGKVEVELHTMGYEVFGNSYLEKKPEKIEQLAEKVNNIKVNGLIRKRSPSKIADFSLEMRFDEANRNVYTRFYFNVTPGYEPGELVMSDDPQIMKETGEIVREYFSR